MTIYSQVDLSQIVFQPIQTNSQGGKVVYMHMRGKDGYRVPIKFQMCSQSLNDLQMCPYGVSTPQSTEMAANYRRTLDLTVDDAQCAFIRQLDTLILDTAVAKSTEWFNVCHERPHLEHMMYQPILHSPTQSDRPHTMRTKVKLPMPEDDRGGRKYVPTNLGIVQDSNACVNFRKSHDFDAVTKLSKCMVIVEISSVWFINKRTFGITLIVNDMMVWPHKSENGFETDVKLIEMADAETVEDGAQEWSPSMVTL